MSCRVGVYSLYRVRDISRCIYDSALPTGLMGKGKNIEIRNPVRGQAGRHAVRAGIFWAHRDARPCGPATWHGAGRLGEIFPTAAGCVSYQLQLR